MYLDRLSAADVNSELIARDALAASQWELALADHSGFGPGDVWPSRNLTSFSRWLSLNWEAARNSGSPEHDRCLLTGNQADRLWQKVIAESAEGQGLLSVNGMARLARDARGRLFDFGLDPSDLRGSAWSGDSAAFLRWNRAFERELREQGWIDAESLLYHVNRFALPESGERVVLLDPGPASPERLRLQTGWEDRGVPVETVYAEAHRAVPTALLTADARSELIHAAEWASRRLVTEPGQRVAIVVPGLEARRDEVEDLFSAVAGSSDFGIDAQSRLKDVGVCGAAAAALAMIGSGSDFGSVSRWLRSPFFGEADADGSVERLALERWLRSDPRSGKFVDGYLHHGLRDEFRRRAPGFARRLELALAELPRRATPTGWAQSLQRYLQVLGWKGFDGDLPDSIRNAWDAAWSAFAELTAITGELDQSAAIREFDRVLGRQSLYRPLARSGIHVLAGLKDVGPGYAGAWIAGFSDLNWPESLSRNPLIPWSIRLQCGMPDAAPDHGLEIARDEFWRLCRRVPEIVFSCPERIDDQPQVPSPFLQGWQRNPAEANGLHLPTGFARLRMGSRPWDSIADRAPPFVGNLIPGGPRTLDLQSRNPAIAFCVARLGAEALEVPVRGIDARLRGILLHRVFELICRPEPETSERSDLSRVVASAVAELVPAGDAAWQTQVEAETQRVCELIERFRDLEDQRTPFTIHGTEQRLAIAVGGYQLNCRIDRIDELESGGQLLIDYKTGRLAVNGWYRDRLRDCQLPLYAQHFRATIVGIAVASLSTDAVAYRAAGSSVEGLPGRHRHFETRAWQEQLLRWYEQIETLLHEFSEGDVRISTDVSARGDEAYVGVTRLREHLR
jgi:probable DNA repair protein